jgi:hypothetical protein
MHCSLARLGWHCLPRAPAAAGSGGGGAAAEMSGSGELDAVQAELEAVHAEIEGVDQELAAEATGAPYAVVAPAVVRSSAAMKSAKVDTLAAGQQILVLERKPLPDGTVRLRYSGGWVSESAQKGRLRLVTPLEPNSGQTRLLSMGFAAPDTGAGPTRKLVAREADAVDEASDTAARLAIAAENEQMRQELLRVEAEIKNTDSLIEQARGSQGEGGRPLQSRLARRARHGTASAAAAIPPAKAAVPKQQKVSRPRSAPQPATRSRAYRALAAGVVRRGVELSSAKVPSKVVAGQVLEALEKRTLKDGTVRLRIRAGWVSEVAKVR